MNLKHPATPMLILVGLTLLFMGATIDLLGNTLHYTYRALQPTLCEIWVFTLKSFSCWLQTTGERLESYFYQVDNSSGTLPSVVDAFWCGLMIDFGKLMRQVGEVIKTAFE